MRIRKSVRALMMVAAPAALLGTLACEDGDSGTNPGTTTYTATLTQLNSSGVTGTATFLVDDDSFEATVDAQGLAPNIVHVQHIRAAASCPAATADANTDGFVDVVEGRSSFGGILIPLDGNVAEQLLGNTDYPASSVQGELFYSREATLIDLLTDLRANDPDPADQMVKLSANGELDLASRTVVIYGIPATQTLPGSVATLQGLTATSSLPIACAQIN